MSKVHVAIAGFLFGIFLAEFGLFFWLAIPLSFFCLFWVGCEKKIALYFLLLMGIGAFRWHVDTWSINDAPLHRIAHGGLQSYFVGTVITEPEFVHQKQRFLIELTNFSLDSKMYFPVSGRILFVTGQYPQYFYGERLSFFGDLVSVEKYVRSGNVDQFYIRDILGVIGNAKNTHTFDDHFFIDGFSLIFSVKKHLVGIINKIFPEPSASFVSGIQLGLRSAIPESILNDFRILGLSHMLAISGFNITLIIHVFASLLQKFSRKMRFSCTVFGIVVFVVLTGMSSSVIRAAVMGLIVVLGSFLGRRTRGVHSVLICIFFMVLLEPRALLHDLSFQLSALATLSLLVVMPYLKKYTNQVPFGLGDDLAVTLAAQVFTTPIMWYHFQMFSVISPVANVLFLPFIPRLMLFSFLAIVLNIVFPPFAQALATFVDFVVGIYLQAIHYFALIPGASLQLPPLSGEITVVFYFVVIWVVTFGRPKWGRCSFRDRVLHVVELPKCQ